MGSFSNMAAPFSTLRRNTRNSATKFAATTQLLNELHNNMDSEMRKNFVGPIPIRKFLDDFLPVQLPSGHLTQLADFKAMGRIKSEKRMYHKFVCSL